MKKHLTHGFTLIELLVVITIIGILMGLGVPAITGALKAAKKTEALTTMHQIQTAWVQYQNEYNTYPDFLTAGAGGDIVIAPDKEPNSWEIIYKVLTATTGTGAAASSDADITKYNPRRIPFIEIPPKYTTQPGDAATDPKSIYDPWGYTYGLALDANYDNQLTGLPDMGTGAKTGNTVNGSVELWTYATEDDPTSVSAAVVKKGVATWK